MKIKLATGHFKSVTAGLSPINNERTELFFAGCKKALYGNPCPECFNSALWSMENCFNQSPQEITEYILKMTDNKYVTIVGGEPFDQSIALLELCEVLKSKGFHIVVITHYLFADLYKQYGDKLDDIDLIIDGEFVKEKSIFYTDKRPGIYNVVGSSNQQLWYNMRCGNAENHGWKNVSKKQDLRPYYTNISNYKRE